ncbi:Dyp-type peroxidase [Brevibacterium litoralis]|uniref:Dyp-type peroxidase n=1 Tax=Brevibacterium litoralis TaxID=3138935 RepID=UPI0032EC3F36
MDLSRRHLLETGAAGVVGVGAGFAAGYVAGPGVRGATPEAAGEGETGAEAGAPRPAGDTGEIGARTEPFHGRHQAGVQTPPQAHARFVAFGLRDGTRAADVVRLLRLLSDDAAALTQGRGPLADSEPELAADPSRLTVTFGFGRGLVRRAGAAAVPEWLGPLPEFSIDRLDPVRSSGDLLLQVCGDDPFVMSHAVRMLVKDARAYAEVRWSRQAFRRAHGAQPAGTTMRNLFGQVDGTANPSPGSEDFARLVWGETLGRAESVSGPRGEPPLDLAAGHPDWMSGGTTLALRDVAMDLETWDEADRPAREFFVGRRLRDGAPLTGEDEFDIPDLEAKDALGLTVISPASHVARARNEGDPAEQIYRRVYSYESVLPDDEARAAGQDPTAGGAPGVTAVGGRAPVGRAGLMFASFQADLERQFLPIQRRLDAMDLLNQWTVPIGSTVWAIPPGAAEGEYVGATLFEG